MFCSNCGKSVGYNDKVCPHCQIELGDVRFEGMPYTSVQFRIVPGTPMPIDKAYSYTRTTYSVNLDGGETPEPVVEDVADEDVESATTYRPVLISEEDEVIQEELPGDAEAEEADEAAAEAPVDVPIDPSELSDEQIDKALSNLRANGLDTDSLRTAGKFTENKKVREDESETTLDERMELYESSIRANEERRFQKNARTKLKFPFLPKKNDYAGVDDADEAYAAEAPYEEMPYEEPAYEDVPAEEFPAEDMPQEAAYDEGYAAEAPADVAEGEAYEGGDAGYYDENGYDEAYDDGQDAPRGNLLNASVAGIRVANILKIVGALVVLVVCVVLGLKWFGYVNDAQKKSPIDGVSLPLYESGIAAITENASSEKTAEMLKTYSGEGVVAFTAVQQQRMDALAALMPAEPAVNDQLFVDAMTTIQTNIANAVIMDGMTGDASSEESKKNWKLIGDSVEALKTATDSVQLQAIVSNKVEVVTTTPTPSPTPVAYKTLARGDEGEDVMKLQQRLFDLGYLADAADGKFGNKTTTAVKYFQMGHDLTVSGIADSATQVVLFSEDALDMEAGKAAYQARQAEANAEDGE